MPLDFDTLSFTEPSWARRISYVRYDPITNKVTFDNEERTEKKMEVKDKICDKCGKRYSVANMRVSDADGYYTDKDCYLDNKTPIENYPKLYHSRADKKYVGRELDLCPECAEKLKEFAGEQ